eukprot:Skav201158  [mRNA]  locus=scaffold65:40764:51572:- [translate_table: standard]
MGGTSARLPGMLIGLPSFESTTAVCSPELPSRQCALLDEAHPGVFRKAEPEARSKGEMSPTTSSAEKLQVESAALPGQLVNQETSIELMMEEKWQQKSHWVATQET